MSSSHDGIVTCTTDNSFTLADTIYIFAALSMCPKLNSMQIACLFYGDDQSSILYFAPFPAACTDMNGFNLISIARLLTNIIMDLDICTNEDEQGDACI